jgi:hypothetical protein
MQLEGFAKAVDCVRKLLVRVDYLIDAAQWMSETGVPKAEIKETLLSAMDAVYDTADAEAKRKKELEAASRAVSPLIMTGLRNKTASSQSLSRATSQHRISSAAAEEDTETLDCRRYEQAARFVQYYIFTTILKFS